MSGVVLDNVSKRFHGSNRNDITAVRNLTFTIAPGEFFVIVGPSGAGKSTLLRLVAGLEQATSGSISLNGQPADRLRADQRDVAMVFQQDALFPHLSVYQNIALGLRLQKVAKCEIDERVGQAAEWLGLQAHFSRYPRELSGGERQRVALARAMVRKPKVFLFDEPLSNLDPPWREKLRTEIRRLHRELKVTVIYVTHDQTEAMSLAYRLAVLDRGMLQQLATPAEIYDSPSNLFVATFFGSPAMNVIEGAVWGGRPAFDSGLKFPIPLPDTLAAFAGKRLMLGLRPEHIRIAANGLFATVDHAERLGSEIILHLLVGKQKLRAKVPAQGNFVNGQSCHLELLIEKAHWFNLENGARIA